MPGLQRFHALRLDNVTRSKEEGLSCLLSLVDAAALKVTRNLNLTLYAVKVIPHQLFPALLAASMETGLAVSTKAIVGAWPFGSLNFSSLQQFTNIPGLCSPEDLHDHPALAAAMSISEQRESRIQDIDITSLHLSERTGTMFLDTLLKGRQAEGECSKKNTCTDQAHKELRILMNSRVTEGEVKPFLKRKRDLLVANIHVHNKRLRVDHCGTDLVEFVLNAVDKKGTTELDLGYNSFENEGLKRILDLIPQFPALTKLCLQYNALKNDDDYDCAISKLATTLHNLPNLKHLNLANNCLNGKLAQLLGPMDQALSHLDLENCRCSKEDIEHLSRSHLTRGLEYLNLSYNKLFARRWDAVKRLLGNVANTIIELDLEACNLDRLREDVAAHLSQLAPRFNCLRKLNIKFNFLPAEGLVNLVVAFRNCSSMVELYLCAEPDAEYWEKDTVGEWFENACRTRLAEVQSLHPRSDVMEVAGSYHFHEHFAFSI